MGGAVSIAPGGIRPYTPAPDFYLQTEFQFGQFAGEGPVHLIFSRNNDLYVLPYAMRVAERAAPQIETVTMGAGDNEVAITGTGLRATTRIAFDGTIGTFRSFDETTGRMTVTAPPAATGRAASSCRQRRRW